MRKILFSFVIAFACMPSLASAASVKVGYVNVPYLIDHSPQAKAASAQLKKEFGPRQEKIQAEQDQYQDLQKKLQKDNLVMSDKKREQAKSQLGDLKRKINRMQQAFRQDVNIKKNKAFKQVRNAVQKAVQKLAEDENYDLIVGRGALYASDEINLTQKILKRMKANYKGD